jgi:hypothetical protein
VRRQPATGPYERMAQRDRDLLLASAMNPCPALGQASMTGKDKGTAPSELRRFTHRLRHAALRLAGPDGPDISARAIRHVRTSRRHVPSSPRRRSGQPM